MKPQQRTATLIFGALGLLGLALFAAPKAQDKPIAPPTTEPKTVATADEPVIQIALLLDTSGSMDGLIHQAKSQLWKIVTELSQAKRGGKAPRLELALYEYGKSSIPENEGYARMIVPFTTELDQVSEALFALSTNGGEEWCGRTISAAVNQLKWSSAPGAMKLIFVAGNESFDQGDLNPREAIQLAQGRGITVNTIYCGNDGNESAGWRNGAVLAEGRFLTIDHNQQVAEIEAPQDAELAQLGVELNTTYIPYGARGAQASANQVAQDNNSVGLGRANLSRRAAAKASAQYYNPGWDLVDAFKGDASKIESLQQEELPEAMRGMSKEEQRQYVAEQAQKREALQKKITALNQARESYVAAERAKQANGPDSLDSAMVEAIRGQAQKHGYAFAP